MNGGIDPWADPRRTTRRVGRIVHATRERVGISQQALTDYVNDDLRPGDRFLYPPQLCHIEHGEGIPSPAHAARLVQFVLECGDSHARGVFGGLPRTPTLAGSTHPPMFRASDAHWQILHCLAWFGGDEQDCGLADFEIAERLVQPQSESGPRVRRIELTAAGWVEDSTLCRKNDAGRRCVVWQVTPLGYTQLEEHR